MAASRENKPATPNPPPKVEVSFSVLKNLKKIGAGGFADVYKARHTVWGCAVAYKKYRLDPFDVEAAEEDKARFVDNVSLAVTSRVYWVVKADAALN